MQRTFTNEFGNDARLLEAVGAKRGAFQDEIARLDRGVNAGRSLTQQQVDSLRVLVKTFQGTDAGDVGIRAAALEKLGQVGRASDIEDILPLVRKPATSADLYNGLESVKKIMDRAGSPQLRGSKYLSSDTRTLLSKSHLTDAERARAIEDVMSHGEIASIKRHVGGNMNEVYFLTYKDSIALADGTRAPIRAVFKPENTYVGKEKPFFTREVSAYEFDRDFAGTGMVPPTVEGILARNQLPGSGRPHGVGSLLMIPIRSRSEEPTHGPEFQAVPESPGGKQQCARSRRLYTLKIRSSVQGGFPTRMGNIMGVPDKGAPAATSYLIENGAGRAPGQADRNESAPDAQHAGRNWSRRRGARSSAPRPLVCEQDAADISRRPTGAARRTPPPAQGGAARSPRPPAPASRRLSSPARGQGRDRASMRAIKRATASCWYFARMRHGPLSGRAGAHHRAIEVTGVEGAPISTKRWSRCSRRQEIGFSTALRGGPARSGSAFTARSFRKFFFCSTTRISARGDPKPAAIPEPT